MSKHEYEGQCPMHGTKVKVTVEVGEDHCHGGEEIYTAPDYEESTATAFGYSPRYSANYDRAFGKN